MHSLLSAHAWLIVGLCLLPLLIWLPLWLLDAGREPSNETVHESSDGRERDPEPPLRSRVSASRWHYQPQ